MNPGDIVAVATGTTGLTVCLMYLVRRLGILHEASDADVKNERDELRTALREEMAGNRAMADAFVGLSTQVKDMAAIVAGLVVKKP